MTRTASLALVVLLLIGCTAGPGATGSPATTPAQHSPTPGSPSPTPDGTSPTPGAPSPTPTQAAPSPASPAPDAAFYLRIWQSQALPPPGTFNWLPMLTISEGSVIDGNVAVPAIYPGPLLILPFEREITADGQSSVVDEARRLGLLGDASDFTGGQAAPGSVLGHIELIVDGVTRELVGHPGLSVPCDSENRCLADPQTPEAFAAFWQQLSYLDGWIADELGPTSTYQPERLAVLVQPAQPDPDGLAPQIVTWRLQADVADFGQPLGGNPDLRCATVTGDDLEVLLPTLNAANQLTVFIDGQDAAGSLLARAVVPGEASPCEDEAG